ncbi:MAG: hypothetical protein KGH61_03945 [Candidatus Micrarchaeota archaeon]|nr:hypothetical protein [Candidatus Micrarchaeota archaeon]MDE1848072.1 hypothetical protein [Candidatus Micrarchaeota archaeon]MDE1864873.1 hypothetical protein [Candidatus Micrarchaeota archaeon]
MSTKNIEVEVRGRLSKPEHSRLSLFLRRNGEFLSRKKRLLIDYSTIAEGIENRKMDIRCRITGDEPEIIIKKGNMTSIAREETSVRLQKGEFPNAIKLMKLLGYEKGVATTRVISKYLYKRTEFSLVEIIRINKKFKENEVCDYSYEAEVMSDTAGVVRAKQKLNKMLLKLDLPIFGEYLGALPPGSSIRVHEFSFGDYLRELHKSATIVMDANRDYGSISSYANKRFHP